MRLPERTKRRLQQPKEAAIISEQLEVHRLDRLIFGVVTFIATLLVSLPRSVFLALRGLDRLSVVMDQGRLVPPRLALLITTLSLAIVLSSIRKEASHPFDAIEVRYATERLFSGDIGFALLLALPQLLAAFVSYLALGFLWHKMGKSKDTANFLSGYFIVHCQLGYSLFIATLFLLEIPGAFLVLNPWAIGLLYLPWLGLLTPCLFLLVPLFQHGTRYAQQRLRAPPQISHLASFLAATLVSCVVTYGYALLIDRTNAFSTKAAAILEEAFPSKPFEYSTQLSLSAYQCTDGYLRGCTVVLRNDGHNDAIFESAQIDVKATTYTGSEVEISSKAKINIADKYFDDCCFILPSSRSVVLRIEGLRESLCEVEPAYVRHDMAGGDRKINELRFILQLSVLHLNRRAKRLPFQLSKFNQARLLAYLGKYCS